MQVRHIRFVKHRGARWALSIGLVGALVLPSASATAQNDIQTTTVAATPSDCTIQLSVANPTAGDQLVPRSLVMSGLALDATAPSGAGISKVQAFLGDRDLGGMFVGAASFSPTFPGAWSLTATIPSNISGGQHIVVYGTSAVSGQQASVSIPIVVGEDLTNQLVSDTPNAFCPSVMTPTPVPTAPAVAATATPIPTLAAPPTATPQPVAPLAPPATATPVPAAPPAPAAPPVPVIGLSISTPPAPPLTFDTTMLTAPAGAQVTLTYTNNSAGVPHNWHLFNGADDSAPSLAETQIMTGPGAVESVSFTAPSQPGSYFYRCDVHPTIMTGDLVIDGAQQ